MCALVTAGADCCCDSEMCSGVSVVLMGGDG